MIIGNGDIAQALNDRDGAIFFASGVSDSSCTDSDQFNRERDLLMSALWDSMDHRKCLFYFSSIAIFETHRESIYLEHKKEMEQLIRDSYSNYNIIRIGNIDWGSNPNTFLNYLRNKKKNGESINVFNEMKYMISQKELLLITDNIPLNGRNEINVFGKMAMVADLI